MIHVSFCVTSHFSDLDSHLTQVFFFLIIQSIAEQGRNAIGYCMFWVESFYRII